MAEDNIHPVPNLMKVLALLEELIRTFVRTKIFLFLHRENVEHTNDHIHPIFGLAVDDRLENVRVNHLADFKAVEEVDDLQIANSDRLLKAVQRNLEVLTCMF